MALGSAGLNSRWSDSQRGAADFNVVSQNGFCGQSPAIVAVRTDVLLAGTWKPVYLDLLKLYCLANIHIRHSPRKPHLLYGTKIRSKLCLEQD